MHYHVIIDGNNLLHAMYNGGQLRSMTRAALVTAIEGWARKVDDSVTLVFDGPPPPEGFRKTVSSNYLNVQFSAPETADDVIIRMVHEARHPETLRIVSSDTAITYEARGRRSLEVSCADFMEEITRDAGLENNVPPPEPEKPHETLAQEETDQWLHEFGLDGDEEPFDGHDDILGL